MSMLTPHASSAYISPFYEDLQYNIDCFNPYLYPNYPSFQTYSSHDDHNSYQLHSHGAFKNVEGSKPRRRKLNRRSTRFASGKISTKVKLKLFNLTNFHIRAKLSKKRTHHGLKTTLLSASRYHPSLMFQWIVKTVL